MCNQSGSLRQSTFRRPIIVRGDGRTSRAARVAPLRFHRRPISMQYPHGRLRQSAIRPTKPIRFGSSTTRKTTTNDPKAAPPRLTSDQKLMATQFRPAPLRLPASLQGTTRHIRREKCSTKSLSPQKPQGKTQHVIFGHQKSNL